MKFAFLLLLLFCSSAHAIVPAGIEWEKSSVELAMQKAAKLNKPLFLYWGAVWCPPCNQIKKTIFTQKEFRQESQNLINIYLDGDQPRAQKWGEHFKAAGYPTMMILSPVGKEVARMPFGLNVAQYVKLMQNIRNNMKPMEELLKLAIAGKASTSDYKRIIGYSWGQDRLLKEKYLGKESKASTFKKLYQNAPTKPAYIKNHLFLRYHLAEYDKDKKYRRLDKKDYQTLTNILTKADQQQSLIALVNYNGKKLRSIFVADNKKNEFHANFFRLMSRIRNNTNFSLDDRLSTLYSLIDLKEKPTAADKSLIRQWAKKAGKESSDSLERQATMTTAVWLLKSSGQLAEAKKLALYEKDHSHSPYYFMSYLGSIEREQKNNKAALHWYKQAWKVSKGKATRFEWGTGYLLNRIKLSPNDFAQFYVDYQVLVKELFERQDPFFARTKKRLERLSKAIGEWSPKRSKQELKKLKKVFNKECKRTQTKDVISKCRSWSAIF
jgi:thioredoxin-related protein